MPLWSLNPVIVRLASASVRAGGSGRYFAACFVAAAFFDGATRSASGRGRVTAKVEPLIA
jgi:hypothetical protein